MNIARKRAPQFCAGCFLAIASFAMTNALDAQGVPEATDDVVTVFAGTTAIVDVLENDSPAGEIEIKSLSVPSIGDSSVNDDGTISYTTTPEASGADAFSYELGWLSQQTQGSDTTNGDRFGAAVDIEGDHSIVGARLAEGDGQPVSSGLAYVYRHLLGEWREVAALQAPDAQAGDYFGSSVAISGSWAVVGAYRADGDSAVDAGAVYLFNRNEGGSNNWGFVARIDNPTPNALDHFGISVSIDGNRLAVGTWLDDDPNRPGSNHGSVSLFERNLGGVNNWGHRTTIFNSSPIGAADSFGIDVELDGNTLAASADRYGAANTGAVFVYDRNQGGANNWGEIQRVDNPEPDAGDYFGSAISLSNGTLAVGSRADDLPTSLNAGSVFLFEQDGAWGQVAKLTSDSANDPLDGSGYDSFGSDVAIDGDRLVVGASGTNRSYGATGLVYTYQRDAAGAWFFSSIEEADDAGPGDRLGNAVAISGTKTVLGVPLDDQVGANDGSVHFLDLATDVATVEVTIEALPELVVDSVDGGSDGNYSPGNRSLREAIEYANLIPGPDVITFDEASGVFSDLTEDTITFLSHVEITDSLTIVGPATASLTISAGPNTRHLWIKGTQSNQLNVTLEQLTFTNGSAKSESYGDIENNGGSILAEYSDLTINNCAFLNNEADYYRDTLGAAIYFLGDSQTLNISDSYFVDNELGGAVSVYSQVSPVNIFRSNFESNSAEWNGGAINAVGVVLTVEDCDFHSNTTNFDGDGGGAIYVEGDSRILRTQFTKNRTFYGSTGIGGAIYSVGAIEIFDSTLNENSSGWGASALSHRGGDLSISNSTISGNRSTSGYGSTFAIASSADALILNCTVVNNDGYGIVGGSNMLLMNSIVAGNRWFGRYGFSFHSDLDGTISAASSNNLIGDPGSAGGLTHGVSGNILGDGAGGLLSTSSILDPLADNGGPTPTHLLVVGSPAIDTGDSAFATELVEDQRGLARVVGQVDIGAVEIQVIE